ncbi:MAG: nucleoside permease [Planctomycetaceae bacterium]|nr:nucleoside permease [Planctomycetales bacterium]MCB9925045.1 nucleoside permease [Planctomycetaceae bacterium]
MNKPATSSPSGMVTLLSIMMFLQFFAWGAWFATLSAALDANGLGAIIGPAYECAPIAAIFAPLFLGLIADRFFASERVMSGLMLIGGGIMCAIPVVAARGEGSGKLLVWLILGHMLCYMPTLGLSNTIAFTHIPHQDMFPKIRVWGTIGWIVAGLVLGAMGWSASFNIFWLGAASSIMLGLFCFALPHTPPPLKGKPMDLRSLFMVDAFKLLADWNFLVFAVCSTLICIPLAYYYGMTSTFLNQTGFAEPGATMTIGQMSEIFFMLLIPFFFRKLGIKIMILIGMACWVVRYALFSFGAPDQVTWMLLLAVALHGICYDFFFVTGFMYTDQKAPKSIRGQAQGLLVFLTQGIGMFFGFRIMAGGNLFGVIPLNLTVGEYGKQVASSTEYVAALKEARGDTAALDFFSTFTQMFSRSLPSELDPGILATTMGEWKNFWLLPAIMAAAILIVFAVGFWDKRKQDEGEATDIA